VLKWKTMMYLYDAPLNNETQYSSKTALLLYTALNEHSEFVIETTGDEIRLNIKTHLAFILGLNTLWFVMYSDTIKRAQEFCEQYQKIHFVVQNIAKEISDKEGI